MPEPLSGSNQCYCPACGQVILAAAEICPYCGIRKPSVINPKRRNKTVTALLGVLLGIVGAHKFYLGKIGMGILYLLFFWTGIPLIVGIIEGVYYLTLDDAEFDAKYNRP